jgi:uncharacterized protein YjiS (DUF1127 family)
MNPSRGQTAGAARPEQILQPIRIAEIDMRTIAGAAIARSAMAEPILSQRSRVNERGSAVTRWVAAYMAWRIERRAIALLGAMSDYELRDIGLTRGEIEAAARGGAGDRRA